MVHRMYPEEILLYTAESRVYKSCLFPAAVTGQSLVPALTYVTRFVLCGRQGHGEGHRTSKTAKQFANIQDYGNAK